MVIVVLPSPFPAVFRRISPRAVYESTREDVRPLIEPFVRKTLWCDKSVFFTRGAFALALQIIIINSQIQQHDLIKG